MASSRNYLQIITVAHADNPDEIKNTKIENVFNYFRTGASASPSKSAAITAFTTSTLASLLLCLSENTLYDEIWARFIDDYLDPYLKVTSSAVGAVAGDSLPSVNCVTVQLKSPLRGSGSRGSKHFGLIAESDTLNDKLSAAALVKWETFATAYRAGFTSSDSFTYVPFIAQARPQGVPFEYQDVTGNPVSATRINPVLGTMMHRKQPPQ